jgi:hypothetical protein
LDCAIFDSPGSEIFSTISGQERSFVDRRMSRDSGGQQAPPRF